MIRNNPARENTGLRSREAFGGGDAPDAARRRLAELEAENAALRRALADAGAEAGRATARHGADLAREQAGRAADAAEAREVSAGAEARHGREMAAGRNDLAASEASNAALRSANLDLEASRAALRESEERLRLILDSAADYAIFSMDLERRVASWNAGAERLLGWSGEEILGRSADAIFVPEDREAGVPAQEGGDALRHGRASDERWHRRKDGTRFWANGLMLPLRDPEAGPASPPIGLLKVLRDETERRRVEEASRESEARFRALTRASSDVLYRMSPDWAEMRQLSGGGFINDAPHARRDWMEDYIHPDDRPLVQAAIQEAIRTKGVFELEHRVRRADGSFGWTLSRAVPILGADGGIAEWFGAGSDVTARREAEERLRASEARWRGLFERMQEGFSLAEMVYGPDGEAVDYRFLEVNAAWERQTGIPREAAVGRPVTEVVAPDEAAFWVETYARVAETGEPAHVERRITSLGRSFEVMMHRFEPGRVAALVIDATERRLAEARRDALVELGDRLRALRDPGEIARAAAEVIGRALGAARAGYCTVDADGDGIAIERDWTRDPAVANITGRHRLSDYWAADKVENLRRGAVVAVADVSRDPRTAPHAAAFAALGIASCLHAPVVEAGRLTALIYLHAAEARNWTEEEIDFVRGAAERTWAAAERAQAERRRALLLGELNHRVKNTLAVVQSLALQTARGAPDLPAFTAAFQARLVALARAHDLLTRENWEGAALGAVVRAALAPGGEARVDLGGCGPDGPLLAPPQALALALALHELGTNALKHGALSAPGGRVSVLCRDDPGNGAPVVEWLERGGPRIAGPPARRGFGLRLLGRGLALQAGVAADLRFEPEGLRCELRLPPAR